MTAGNSEDYDRALEYFNQALSAAEQAGNEAFEVAVLNNIGSLKAHLEENLMPFIILTKPEIWLKRLNSIIIWYLSIRILVLSMPGKVIIRTRLFIMIKL